MSVDDNIETLYNFYEGVKDRIEYLGVFEIMVTGYAIMNNVSRKLVVDSLYYCSQNKGQFHEK